MHVKVYISILVHFLVLSIKCSLVVFTFQGQAVLTCIKLYDLKIGKRAHYPHVICK